MPITAENKPIEEYTTAELDQLELKARRGFMAAQEDLQGFGRNILAVQAERQRREIEESKKEKVKPEAK